MSGISKEAYLASISTDLHSGGKPTLQDRIQKEGVEAQLRGRKAPAKMKAKKKRGTRKRRPKKPNITK